MKEIEIFEANTIHLLAQTVNEKLRQGYELHGSPFSVPAVKPITIGTGTAFQSQVAATVCQMMVKPEKS
jgi:hypothetical protein